MCRRWPVTSQEKRVETPLHRQLITFGTLHPSDSSSSSPNFYHWEDHYMRNGVLMPTWALTPVTQIISGSADYGIVTSEETPEWVVPEPGVGKWWQWFKCPGLWLTAASLSLAASITLMGGDSLSLITISDVEARRRGQPPFYSPNFWERLMLHSSKELIYVSLNTIPWL